MYMTYKELAHVLLKLPENQQNQAVQVTGQYLRPTKLATSFPVFEIGIIDSEITLWINDRYKL